MIRCFECREYDHFARECPTRQASREAEQRQQMFNMDKDQTILQTPLMDTDQDEQTITLKKTTNVQYGQRLENITDSINGHRPR